MPQKDRQEEEGGAGVYNADLRKGYDLPDEWKYDVMPETLDGHNIADFVDPDIDAKLEALEREEDELLRAWREEVGGDDLGEEMTPEEHAMLIRIKDKKKQVKVLSRQKKATAANRPVVPRTAERYDAERRLQKGKEELRGRGVDTEKAEARMR